MIGTMRGRFCSCLAGVVFGFGALMAAEPTPKVRFDTSESPESAAWAASAETLAREWYPRLGNLLSSGIENELPEVVIRVTPKFQGVAAASGNRIEMSAKRVLALPDDSRGVVVHELVHVVQAYPAGSEGWLTEGIADYLRCAVYESLPLAEFPRPDKERGYRDSYKVAAGFLFWLESGPAPGIVRQVNAALRRGTYKESVFEDRTGRSVEVLWRDYLTAFQAPVPLPPDPVRWRHSGGTFERQSDGTWGEFKAGQKIWSFREESRSTDHIQIHDSGRNLRLRLTAREVLLEQGKGWGVLYRGSWERLKAP